MINFYRGVGRLILRVDATTSVEHGAKDPEGRLVGGLYKRYTDIFAIARDLAELRVKSSFLVGIDRTKAANGEEFNVLCALKDTDTRRNLPDKQFQELSGGDGSSTGTTALLLHYLPIRLKTVDSSLRFAVWTCSPPFFNTKSCINRHDDHSDHQ